VGSNHTEEHVTFFSMGDLLLLAITCVCRLHWSARRGSWSRVVRWGVDFLRTTVFYTVTTLIYVERIDWEPTPIKAGVLLFILRS